MNYDDYDRFYGESPSEPEVIDTLSSDDLRRTFQRLLVIISKFSNEGDNLYADLFKYPLDSYSPESIEPALRAAEQKTVDKLKKFAELVCDTAEDVADVLGELALQKANPDWDTLEQTSLEPLAQLYALGYKEEGQYVPEENDSVKTYRLCLEDARMALIADFVKTIFDNRAELVEYYQNKKCSESLRFDWDPFPAPPFKNSMRHIKDSPFLRLCEEMYRE